MRIQLQTEELMMTSLKESVQENFGSVSQADIFAHQLASSLQSEMPQATTACNSRKIEVLRLTQEVAEQSTKRKAGGTLHITHLFIYHRQKKLIHHFRR